MIGYSEKRWGVALLEVRALVGHTSPLTFICGFAGAQGIRRTLAMRGKDTRLEVA